MRIELMKVSISTTPKRSNCATIRATLSSVLLIAWMVVLFPGSASSTVFFDPLPPLSAGMSIPVDVALTPTGEAYVADGNLNYVWKYNTNGSLVSLISVFRPSSVAVAPNSTIYVGSNDGSVRIFNQAQAPIGYLGAGVGEFDLPANITIDPASGNVYVVDQGQFHECIKVYSAAGTYLFSINDDPDDNPQDAVVIGSELFVIYTSAISDPNDPDNITEDAWVQVLDLNGNPLRRFGTFYNQGGIFYSPRGITADDRGIVYVSGLFYLSEVSGTVIYAVACFNGATGEYLGAIRDPDTPGNITTGIAIAENYLLLVVSNATGSRLVRRYQIKTMTPPDGAVDVELDTGLGWLSSNAGATHDLYLDTDETFTAPSVFQGLTEPSFSPEEPWAINTTYYWKVVSTAGEDSVTMGPWSFTTAKDDDGDGTTNASDNCPAIYNPDQTDDDGDGFGDVCDCDDGDTAVNPDADETPYNDKDDDCDPTTPDDDLDGDGYPLAEDCDDNNPTVHPGAEEVCDSIDNNCVDGIDEPGATGSTFYYVDGDNDGYGNPADGGQFFCNDPGTGFSLTNDDCDDTNDVVHPDAYEVCDLIDNNCINGIDEPGAIGSITYYIDDDNDGYGDSTDAGQALCLPPVSSFSLTNDDCNDQSAAVHPDADEICDSVDNNCANGIDEPGAIGGTTFYVDGDNDGYGDSGDSGLPFCSDPGSGYSLTNDDCDDTRYAVHPDADEICDSIDNNCDGNIDETGMVGATVYYIDGDNDGYGDPADNGQPLCNDPGSGFSITNNDCDDGDSAIHPDTEEICDSIDNNCADGIDEPGATNGISYYVDGDSDGFGDLSDNGQTFCTPPGGGYSLTNDDCDDANDTVHPDAEELCDGLDNNCTDGIDEPGASDGTTYYLDTDNDSYGDSTDSGLSYCSDPGEGFSLNNDDCDDTDVGEYPGVIWYADVDGDGFGDPAFSRICLRADDTDVLDNSDCDDANDTVHPGAEEICDGIDNNCTAGIDEGDTDNDHIADCDDNFPSIPIAAGDLNNDGAVDLEDAIRALQLINGLTPAGTFFIEADVDGDGRITGADALYVLQSIAGWRPQYP